MRRVSRSRADWYDVHSRRRSRAPSIVLLSGILSAAGPVKVRAVALMLNPMTLHHRRCREVRADMSAYLDGELDAARAMRVKRHAQWCPNCRRMLKNLRRTIAGMRALRSEDPFVT